MTVFQILYDVGSDKFGDFTEGFLRIGEDIFAVLKSPVNFECEGEDINDAAVKYVIIQNLLPAIFLAIIGSMFMLFKKCPCLASLPTRRKPAPAGAVGLVLGGFEMFFVIITRNAASAGFDRLEHPDGSESMTIRPTLSVEDDRADSIIALSVVGVLLWYYVRFKKKKIM